LSDLRTIGLGLLFTLLTFFQLAIWRLLETETFLFIQILVITFVNYLFTLWISPKNSMRIQVNLFGAVLVAFVLVTFTTVNVDRSRSFTTLKWVHELQLSGPVSVDEIENAKRLTARDVTAIEQRIEEQVQFGTLNGKGDGFVLSAFGEIILSIANGLSVVCNLKGYQRM